MTLRFLLLLVVMYFIVKTVRNLIHAMRSDGQPTPPPPRMEMRPPPPPMPPRRPVFQDEVEDARYRDL